MNRADLALVLGQVDNVGNTLLQNRMLKQRKEERAEDMGVRSRERAEDMTLRDKMFTEQQATRKATEQATADWRKETARDRRIQAAIHNNASGTMDDASRTEFNAWIDGDEELRYSGLNLKAPPTKAKGEFNTSQTRNHAELKKLQEQIRMATTPEAKAAAEQDLADFKSLLPGRPEVAKPQPSAEDRELEILQRKRLDAEVEANDDAMTKIDTAISKRGPKGMGAMRQRDEQLMNESAAGQTPPQSVETELKLAQDAIRQGANRAKVAAKFKARTGQDLPQ